MIQAFDSFFYQIKWKNLGISAAASSGAIFAATGSLPISAIALCPVFGAHLSSRYFVKLSVEDKISDLQRDLFVFGITASVFAIAGIALFLLGVGLNSLIAVTFVGITIAFANTYVFHNQAEVCLIRKNIKDNSLIEEKLN